MILAFFQQLEMALRDDEVLTDSWRGVMAVEVGDDWWYVRTTANAGQPECVHGYWAGGPDRVVHVATEDAWQAVLADPESVRAVSAAGLITVDEYDDESRRMVLDHFAALVWARNAYIAAHPAP